MVGERIQGHVDVVVAAEVDGERRVLTEKLQPIGGDPAPGERIVGLLDDGGTSHRDVFDDQT